MGVGSFFTSKEALANVTVSLNVRSGTLAVTGTLAGTGTGTLAGI